MLGIAPNVSKRPKRISDDTNKNNQSKMTCTGLPQRIKMLVESLLTKSDYE